MLGQKVNVDDLVREPAFAKPSAVRFERLGDVGEQLAKDDSKPGRRIGRLDAVGDRHGGELEEAGTVAACQMDRSLDQLSTCSCSLARPTTIDEGKAADQSRG